MGCWENESNYLDAPQEFDPLVSALRAMQAAEAAAPADVVHANCVFAHTESKRAWLERKRAWFAPPCTRRVPRGGDLFAAATAPRASPATVALATCVDVCA